MDKTQRIIRKAIEVLHKDEFIADAQLAYVLGMLESLVEEDVLVVHAGEPIKLTMTEPVINTPTDEASILDAKARAAMKTVQEMSSA